MSYKAQKAYDLAYKYESEKGHCAQCVMVAVKEVNKIEDDYIIRGIDGLTGGTALSTEGTCGALTAGIVAISFITGRTYEDFKTNQKNHTFEYVKKLYNKFVEYYGSPIGKEVQKKVLGRSYDFNNEEDKKAFEKAGGHVDKCPSVCGNVAKWTIEILNNLENIKE